MTRRVLRWTAIGVAAAIAGVRVPAGTDDIAAGPDLHRELRQPVDAGLALAEKVRAVLDGPPPARPAG